MSGGNAWLVGILGGVGCAVVAMLMSRTLYGSKESVRQLTVEELGRRMARGRIVRWVALLCWTAGLLVVIFLFGDLSERQLWRYIAASGLVLISALFGAGDPRDGL